MEKIDKSIDVEKLCDLCKIELSSEEKEELFGDLQAITAFAGTVAEYPEEPFENGQSAFESKLREDIPENGGKREEYLSLAAESDGGYFSVLRVVE